MVVPGCFPSFSFSFKFIRITAIQNNNTKRNEMKNGGPKRQHGRPGRSSGKPKPDNPKPKPDKPKIKPNQPKPKPNQPKPDRPKHNSSVGKSKSRK